MSFSLKHSRVFLADGAGRLPAEPWRHSRGASSDEDQWSTETLYTLSTLFQKKNVQKPTLLTQIAPVYGFGIFLFIIYVFCKVRPIKHDFSNESKLMIHFYHLCEVVCGLVLKKSFYLLCSSHIKPRLQNQAVIFT